MAEGIQSPPLVEKRNGRPPKPKRVEVEGEGVLRAMRFVWKNAKEFDRFPEEHAMRAFLEKRPGEFVAKLNELEGGGKGEGPVDHGSDMIEKQIEKLLQAGVGDVG